VGCLPGCLASGAPCYAGTGQPGLAAAPRVHDVLPGLLRNVFAELRGIALTQLKFLIIIYKMATSYLLYCLLPLFAHTF
jgi:hypothetical protein